MAKVVKTTVSYERDLPEIDGRDPRSAPRQHLRKATGVDGFEVANGRRPSQMLLVNKLRQAVDEWRDADYPGASTTTQELFHWWFDAASATSAEGFAPYWGQREAIETVAYLVEVAHAEDTRRLIEDYAEIRTTTLLPEGVTFETRMDGDRFVTVPTERPTPAMVQLPPESLARYAFKMATGSGKTLVMALVVLWSYFHARREQGSHLSTNFLVVAPNVIVFERLRLDFENGHVFRQRSLVPPGWVFDLKVILRGEASEPGGAGNLFVTNIQQLYESRSEWTPLNAVDALLGRKPTGNAATQGRSMMDRIRSLDRLMVLNDEAHHVHDEDLMWNRTLLGLHETLPEGLSAWLDFSATPRFQSGNHFPWIICDYPLAQAVEDRIVKAPMILHLVDDPDPGSVTRDNVIDKYGNWIVAGVNRLEEHAKAFRDIPGTKPVMFVMCETIQHADKVGAWLTDPASGFRLKPSQVLVIHTDKEGEIRKGQLDELRKAAREIDDPTNPVRVVVSVLVLREGWDVRNVTVVLGLRPGTAAARILPEQAVGRGLRLMPQVDLENRQVLEVLGTPGFENFVRELEAEGVYIPTTTKAPTPPITVQPVRERAAFDIAIPRTSTTLRRSYRRLERFDPSKADPVFELGDIARFRALRLKVEHGTVHTQHGHVTVDRLRPAIAGEIVATIARKTQDIASFTSEFAQLFPLVQAYLEQRCFGEPLDLDADTVRMFLADPPHQERIASFLGRQLGRLTVVQQPIAVESKPIHLSQTSPFHWRRQHTICAKTIFNYVATFNPFETSFAEFLATCDDVARFAALAEHFTGFWVDYLKPSGAIGRYFPDWVAIQETPGGSVNWIIETKGRVWDGTEQKDAAIRYWCEQVTLAGEPWRYMRVDQPIFKPKALASFSELLTLIEERSAVVDAQVLYQPSPTDR